MTASEIIRSSYFENASITVICLNSLMMVMDDPTVEEPNPVFKMAETVFLGLYTVEMVLKIIGMGFYFSENAYIKDGWNILDFVIVVLSLPTLFVTAGGIESQIDIEKLELEGAQSVSGFNIGSLRAFRVLRPLKTISSVKGLKVLMNALISALPLL